MSERKQKRLASLARKLLRARDIGKEGYRRADELLEKLVAQGCGPGDVIPISEGEVVRIVDNFAKGNKAWKPCGISRLDIQVSRASNVV